MKQIEECLERFFYDKKPLKKKWQARSHPENEDIFLLFHYHHLVLVVDLSVGKILKEWWELPADKRGLDAAKKYLKEHDYLH